MIQVKPPHKDYYPPKDNLILMTDSYKIGHHKMLPDHTIGLFSYFESRNGARFDETVFVGLQPILKKLAEGITETDIYHAGLVLDYHLGKDWRGESFNKSGWVHILNKYYGKLPVIIKAVPEGTVVPVNNVMMTIENTDPECPWLVNYLETILTHVWYPSTVATLSRACKKMFKRFADNTCDGTAHLDFQLHDFGYRGVSSHESAQMGGLAHLVNFKGTDTLAALTGLMNYDYLPDFKDADSYSVAASEHSVMTARGPEGEIDVVRQLLSQFPSGILSVVADSYDIYNFVGNIVCKQLKKEILSRDGVFVVRPDSITPVHNTPELLMKYILNTLWCEFDGTHNKKGYKVLDPKIRVIWGDGIGIDGIYKILNMAESQGFASENMVFGMGGGLLQKVNRDTQRFAFKCSSQERQGGPWLDIYKKPLDESKASKKGRLKLVCNTKGEFETVNESVNGYNQLQTVFANGKVLKTNTLAEMRERAKI